MFCNARTRTGGHCRRHALTGKRRCRLHGGLSTGPIFWHGNVEAMARGRKRYIEQLHAMGLKAPGGRLPGPEKMQARVAKTIEGMEHVLRLLDDFEADL